MDSRPGGNDDDTKLTLRAPRSLVAFIVAAAAHVSTFALLASLPEPKPRERIEITVKKTPPPPTAQQPPPPPAATAPPLRPKAAKPPPTPPTLPVAPVLPPSEKPPENRAQLPMVETSPVPAPPPTTSWKDRLKETLAEPPPPRPATGVLSPSFATMNRVAASDARLHDEETERRMHANHGPFFRRGIDALRAQWHPDEVLRSVDQRDPTRMCGKQTRTTWAIAILDKQGDVVDVEVKQDSGCAPLDRESVAAFKRVGRFPFPPAGLFFTPDGAPSETARMPVRFIVSFDGSLRLDWR